jgi:hypothetical protein
MAGHEQRQRLVEALRQTGMQVREPEAEDRDFIYLPLLDTGVTPMINTAQDPELRSYFRQSGKRWPQRAYLYICTAGESPPWRIGVIGHNGETDEDYSPEEWQEVDSVEEAVEAYTRLWRARDTLLNSFIGKLSKS